MIREAVINDAYSLNELNKEALGYRSDLEVTKKQISTLMNSNHHYIRVYECDDEVVGFVHAEIYESLFSETMFNILGLAVDSKYRGRGIGKQLINILEEEAEKRGYRYVRFNSGVERIEAHKFYERLGYENTKVQKRFIKDISKEK